MEPGKLGPIQGPAAVATCRPLRVGAWQFYWYQSINFLNDFGLFYSPVDIGKFILLKSSYVYFYSWMLQNSFLSQEWIHHHHDEDEADLEETKLTKRLLWHLTIVVDVIFGIRYYSRTLLVNMGQMDEWMRIIIVFEVKNNFETWNDFRDY